MIQLKKEAGKCPHIHIFLLSYTQPQLKSIILIAEKLHFNILSFLTLKSLLSPVDIKMTTDNEMKWNETKQNKTNTIFDQRNTDIRNHIYNWQQHCIIKAQLPARSKFPEAFNIFATFSKNRTNILQHHANDANGSTEE